MGGCGGVESRPPLSFVVVRLALSFCRFLVCDFISHDVSVSHSVWLVIFCVVGPGGLAGRGFWSHSSSFGNDMNPKTAYGPKTLTGVIVVSGSVCIWQGFRV